MVAGIVESTLKAAVMEDESRPGDAAAPDPAMRVEQIHDVAELLKECDGGLEGQWSDLLAVDPTAHFNQSPLWCLSWYRAYRDRFDPLVIAGWKGAVLRGIAPLAIERQTGRLTFAGDNQADYRDVVAHPAVREALLLTVLEAYTRTSERHPFKIGPSHAQSPTAALVVSLCRRRRSLWARESSEACSKLNLNSEATEAITRKKWIRRHVNHYKKEGSLRLELIKSPHRWMEIRNLIYDYHSLRQLHAGRGLSFDDACKRDFYDALVAGRSSPMHVAVLHVADRIIAAHCGYVWRDEIAMGIPAFNTLEERNSPGLVLLSMLFREVAAVGIKGVDFTPGLDEYKQRFSDGTVRLPVVHVYKHPAMYAVDSLRDVCRAGIRVCRNHVPQKGIATAMRGLVTRRSNSSVSRSVSAAAEPSAGVVLKRVFAFDVHQVDVDTSSVEVHTNELRPLLAWRVPVLRLREVVQYLSEASAAGDSVHTITDGGGLLGWARTRIAGDGLAVREAGCRLELEAGCAVVYGVKVLTALPGDTLLTVLGALALKLRRSGHKRIVFLTCDIQTEAEMSLPMLRFIRLFEAVR